MEGKNFRQGIVPRPDGDDLIIWLRMESEKRIDIKILDNNKHQIFNYEKTYRILSSNCYYSFLYLV